MGMTKTEAVTRVKTGNFNNDFGFDMQLLVDAVGALGEMLKSGQISKVVRCKDCKYNSGRCHGMYIQFVTCYKTGTPHKENWYCADGERG